MVKKIVLLVVAAYLVWYAVSNPATAAAQVHQLGGLLAGAANGIASFGAALTSGGAG
jgi:hypothetical protein